MALLFYRGFVSEVKNTPVFQHNTFRVKQNFFFPTRVFNETFKTDFDLSMYLTKLHVI